jgi:phosphate acetyltransferase
MNLIQQIRNKAIDAGAVIVLPEASEERNLRAANFVLEARIAELVLIGNETLIKNNALHWNLQHIHKATIIDPVSNPRKQEFAELLMEIRSGKGLEMNQALTLVENPLYLAPLLIKCGEADGEVAGAINATGDVLRPAFQIVKTKPGVKSVSGAFIMLLKDKQYGEDGVLIFADCAVNPDPGIHELAEIAIATAATARDIAGVEPRVAMLSFSTKGSAQHEKVDKVRKATDLARIMAPDLQIDGEMQADAAIVQAIGKSKAPHSKVAGVANVLVFPSLESGNIAYKLVQRLAGAEAIGPVLQGMAAPINDLSRGCSVDDIINLIAITVNQVIAQKSNKTFNKQTLIEV